MRPLGVLVLFLSVPIHVPVPGAAQDPLQRLREPDTAAAPVPEARQVSDRELESDLAAIFDRLDGLETVEASVESGVVTLTGTVLTSGDRERAAEVTRAVPGVLYVNDRLEVETSIRNRLRPALERIGDRLLDFVAFLPLLLFALSVIALFFLLARWLGRMERPYGVLTANPFVQNVLRQVVRAVVFVTGLLLAVELLGATAIVGAVIGAAGVAGIALGFAFKDIVENYLAGVILSFRQPFAAHDIVEIEGREGKVIRLTSRETVLLAPDGNHVRIPNAAVFRTVVVNYTRNPLRRFEFRVAIGTGENVRSAQEVVFATLSAMEGVLEHPAPTTRVHELGDSSVTLRVWGWVDQSAADFLKVRSEAVRLVKAALEEAGIGMPPPEFRLQLLRRPRPAAERPPGDEPSGPPGPGGTEQREVGVDHHLDEQVEADRRTSDEEDLLEPDADQAG